MDNVSTGTSENVAQAITQKNFKLVEGDIRNYSDCQIAAHGCNYVLDQRHWEVSHARSLPR